MPKFNPHPQFSPTFHAILFFLKILYMRFTVKPRFLIQIVMNFGVMASDRPYITQILLTMPL